jgi:ElaB/YqjD/DUF883 family membrane-anchored ribosome-binding protein
MAETRGTTPRPGGSNSDPASTSTSDRLASKAHETVDKVAETAKHAEQQARSAAAKTAEKAREAQDQIRAAADEGFDKVRTYVERNPLASAGIAFAAGIVLSSLLRR